MLKPEQVPDKVVAAARDAWLGSDVSAQEDWRIAIAAAINAWPGKEIEMVGDDYDFLILPLPTSLQKMQTTQSGDAGDE